MGQRTCSGKKKRNVLKERACKLWEKRNYEQNEDLCLWLDNEKVVKIQIRKNRPKDWL